MPLFMYVGKMRQGKSYCAVKKIDELQKENKKNLDSNREVFISHLNYFKDRGLEDDLQPFIQLLDCEQFPEYHESLKVPYDQFIDKYNKDNDAKLEKLKPVRQIYTDINGTIENGLIPNLLPAPDDWRLTPKGSIIFYDEFQIHRPAFKFAGNVLSKDQMIIDISTIGHVDKDLYLITQDAENLNFSLRKLIDKMYFVKRPPQNINACSIYTFDCFLKNPKAAAESKRDPKKYIHWEVVRYNNYIYSLYKSASSHDSIKKKIPLAFYLRIFLILCIFGAVCYGLFASPFIGFFMQAIKTMTNTNISSVSDLTKNGVVPTPSPEKNNDKNSTSSTNTVSDLNVECRKAQNLEKPECIKWFDELTKSGSSAQFVNPDGSKNVQYDPSNPYDTKIQESFQYEVTTKPVFSGCTKMNGKYQAWTQQGTKLDVSESDCKKLMAGDRPFNYFAEKKDTLTPTTSTTNLSTQQQTQNKMTPDEYARYLQYLDDKNQSHNYVQDNLKHNPINGAHAL